MVFQSYALFPHMNVKNNIAYGLKLKKLSKNDIDEKVKAIINLLGLNENATKFPSQMSGGQQQRVAIARALINNPSLILADEPTGNLDSKTAKEIMLVLAKLNKDGNTIVVVTHEDDIAAYAKRIIRLKDGKII